MKKIFQNKKIILSIAVIAIIIIALIVALFVFPKKEKLATNSESQAETSTETVITGGRDVYVPGSFPGKSWDPMSNKMEYMGDGLYKFTFKDVEPQNYEYKIALGSWNENYGVGGESDGENYCVNVPTKQDVTIYYQDMTTHLSVTSLNYRFADAYIEGNGIEKTILNDKGLTGVYSAKVNLKKGTYSDIKLSSTMEGEKNSDEFVFDEFEVDEDKEVTFYFNPEFGVYYNDATKWESDDSKISFDTKDSNYKSIFGAVATGEKVKFSISADDNITAAKLYVKQNDVENFDLKKDSEGKWSAEVSFDEIGQYQYFFVLYSGSAVKVYCDDKNKDYGKGILASLNEVIPYDLSVYDSAFTTPDWMKNAVIYQIFPDRFCNGNKDNDTAQTASRGATDYELVDWSLYPENPEQEGLRSESDYKATNAFWGDRVWNNEIYGGDFQGIVDNIDYLKALGVNVIYLNPVFSSVSSHRYDESDYTTMDPILGGDGDFAKLVEIAQQNDMKIVLDGVFNHVSDDSIYFDRYYKYLTAEDFNGKIGAYPYWAYVYDYMESEDVSKEDAQKKAKEYFKKEYNVTDFSYITWFDIYNEPMMDDDTPITDEIGIRSGKPVYSYDGWWGYDNMPVIKATNGSEYQTKSWAEEIIGNSSVNNGSIAQYWISQGTNGWRLDVANEVSDETWQNFRKSVKAMGSDNVIIGEIWNDATEYLLGDMYDSVMNYVFRDAVLSFAKGGSATESMSALEKLRERYPQEAFYAMMNLVGSHDTTRVLSYLDGIADDRNKKDVKSAFPTYENTTEAAKKRQYMVALLQFTYAGAPMIYYGDEIGMVGADDPDCRRAFEWGNGNEELVKYYATLADIRKSYSALRTGSVAPITTGSTNVLGYVRSDEEDNLVILANNTAKDITYSLDLAANNLLAGESYTELLSSTKYDIQAGSTTINVTIPAYSGIILTTNPKQISVDENSLKKAYVK